MIDIAARWRAFEDELRAAGLGWALHHAPAQLRWARTPEHRFGARVEHLLPADYRAFVGEVGYPVVGLGYYDGQGWSMLPPEAMAALSVDLPDAEDEWPQAVNGEPTVCLHAFFAGADLSDVEGYSFGPSADAGGLVVWLVEGGMPREEIGTFTEWLDGEIDRLRERINALDAAEAAALREENDGEDDPHRLLDYSLGGSYDQESFQQADLGLSWVESQAGTPYSYGLVDAAGAWLIPLGKRFLGVRPFRGGAAEVIIDGSDASYTGPWTRIGADGSSVERL